MKRRIVPARFSRALAWNDYPKRVPIGGFIHLLPVRIASTLWEAYRSEAAGLIF